MGTSFSDGKEYYHKGEYRKAIEEWKKVEEENSSYLLAIYNIGTSHLKLKNHREAISIFKDLASKCFRENDISLASKAIYQLGIEYDSYFPKNSSRYSKEALRALKLAEALNPDDSDSITSSKIYHRKLKEAMSNE